MRANSSPQDKVCRKPGGTDCEKCLRASKRHLGGQWSHRMLLVAQSPARGQREGAAGLVGDSARHRETGGGQGLRARQASWEPVFLCLS